jgi:preprotein translocase subunit SecG
LPDDDSRRNGGHLQRSDGSGGENPGMKRTTFTIAALFVAFTIAALIVLSAITMGAVAGT